MQQCTWASTAALTKKNGKPSWQIDWPPKALPGKNGEKFQHYSLAQRKLRNFVQDYSVGFLFPSLH